MGIGSEWVDSGRFRPGIPRKSGQNGSILAGEPCATAAQLTGASAKSDPSAKLIRAVLLYHACARLLQSSASPGGVRQPTAACDAAEAVQCFSIITYPWAVVRHAAKLLLHHQVQRAVRAQSAAAPASSPPDAEHAAAEHATAAARLHRKCGLALCSCPYERHDVVAGFEGFGTGRWWSSCCSGARGAAAGAGLDARRHHLAAAGGPGRGRGRQGAQLGRAPRSS